MMKPGYQGPPIRELPKPPSGPAPGESTAPPLVISIAASAREILTWYGKSYHYVADVDPGSTGPGDPIDPSVWCVCGAECGEDEECPEWVSIHEAIQRIDPNGDPKPLHLVAVDLPRMMPKQPPADTDWIEMERA